jgi:hypothetical protein
LRHQDQENYGGGIFARVNFFISHPPGKGNPVQVGQWVCRIDNILLIESSESI